MRTVLVTGACGGMGHAAVELLAEQGCLVFALDMNPCDSTESIIPVVADITSEESVLSALEFIRSQTEELDAVIHFAGIYMLDSLVEMSEDAFKRILNVNLVGAFLVNKTFLPLLKKESRVLIITSELADLDPLPFTGVYAVTKGALDRYAYSLRMELQLLGIKVSVLRAGAVETKMLGVSTDALDRFCEGTKLYSCNATRFKSIVNRVEARCIPPQKIAKKVLKMLKKRNPSFAYSINRNPLLVLLNLLPKRIQLWAIKLVLK